MAYNTNIDKNSIIISYKGVALHFLIDSFVNKTTTHHKGSEVTTSASTSVDEWLTLASEDWIFEDEILLRKNKMLSKGDFELESIEFNNKFEIFSYNQLYALKIFSPKVIDKFSKIEVSKHFEDFRITEKGPRVHFYRMYNRANYYCELVTFKVSAWTATRLLVHE